MLSAWFRMKYPNLVNGALAASAPLKQFVSDCDSFSATATNTFRKAVSECPNVILKSWDVMNKFSKDKKGLDLLSQIFKLCNPLESVEVLKDWLNDLYGSAAMANYPYPANFLSPLPAWPVKVMCSEIVNTLEKSSKNEDPVEILKAVYSGVNVYQNYTGQTPCTDINTDINAGNVNMISWEYQTCTEFVFPMCSNGVNDMYEPQKWDLNSYCLGCYSQFKTVPRSEWPVINYGVSESDLKSYSNIIFSNGG